MKKVILMLMALSLLLCACGSDQPVSTSPNNYAEPSIYTEEPPTSEVSLASDGLEFEKSSSNPYYEVTGIGVCTDSTVIVPAIYNGLPVKGIAKRAFKECTSFTKIVLPDSIEYIGVEAFQRCSNLTEIILPEGLKQIPDGAFSGTGLTSITIPSSVVSIGKSAFNYCKSLQNIDLPPHISEISNSCFNQCYSLESIIIPEGVTIIEYGAFYECTSLSSVSLPESLVELQGAFAYCTSLKTITIPKNAENVHASEFAGCDIEIHCYADIDLSHLLSVNGTVKYY